MNTNRQGGAKIAARGLEVAPGRARVYGLCALCYLSGGLSAWWLAAPRAGKQHDAVTDAGPAESARPAPQAPSSAKRRQVERPFLVRSVDSCAGKDPEAEHTYKTQQAAELMGLLRSMLKRAELIGVGGPEDVSAHLNQYLHGWTDAFVRTAPDMFDEFSSEIEQLMCDAQARDTQLMMVSQLLQRIPELGSERAFACVVQRGKEDPVLWETLEAWRQSDVPESAAMQELAANAQDERTRQMLQREREDAEREPSDLTPPGPAEKVEAEAAPLQERDVMLALRHAQRTGNAESEKALAATLARLRGAVTQ